MRTGRILSRRALWVSVTIPLALLFAILLALSLSRARAVAQPAAGELEVSKEVNAAQAEPGELLTYTIHVRDTGGLPTYGAWLTDTLADELIFVSDSLTATYGSFGFANGVITWTGDLGDVWITFTAQISPAIGSTTIVNTAEVTGAGELVSGSASTAVSPGRLEALKAASSSSIRSGQRLTYTVSITNTGSGVVAAAWMSDTLPPEVNYVGGLNASTGNCGVAGNTITWTGSLAPSATVLVTFAVELAPSASGGVRFTNTATITGAGSLVQAAIGVTTFVTRYVYLPLVARNYPPIPVLNAIPAPTSSGDYTVSWSFSATGIDWFVLQESTDANFVNVTRAFTTTGTSQLIQRGTLYGGTLYYRVRADDADRWGQGPWSNVQSISLGYFDDFSNPSSGWPQFENLIIPSTKTYTRGRYENGQYRIMIDPGGPDVWFRQPSALAPYRPPTDRYCIEADIKFMKRQPPYNPSDGGWNFYPYWANAGLIFGTNEANTDLFAVCLAIGNELSPGGDAIMGWYIVHNTNSRWPYEGCHAGGYGIVPPGAYERSGLNTAYWYRFQVSVDGEQASLYLNGVNKGSWLLGGLSGTTRVGVTGGPYEVTPVDIRFDNFRVLPNMTCTPSAP